ncbi:uncharacterized protein [Dysidea avara]|uniref:uncharacterized protein n=1 Tax=Dysidea avara TaxID=196820 RepID=UPI003321FB1C
MTTSSSTTVIPDGKQRCDTPDWCDLHRNVVSQYAVHWKAIGAELGLEHYHISNISEDHCNRTEDGCAEMLKRWLDDGTSPTWGRLDDAISEVINRKQLYHLHSIHLMAVMH